MENQFDNTLVNEIEGGSKRPQFLTVLCVLSFVWCGLAFLLGVYGIIVNTPEKMQENIENMRKFSPAGAQQMEEQMIEQQNSTLGKIQPYLSLVFLMVSFLGVMQMFKLKKTGFYIYAAAELIPYAFILVGGKQAMAMMGSMGGGAMQTAAMVMMVLMVLFDLAFVVMYGVNLKHMNK
jgi:tryptophan-rich sensory protein